jgi:hypothetical protein
MGSVFYRNGGSANVPNKHALFEDLDFFSSLDGSIYLPAGQDGSRRNESCDHRMFSHDESACGMDFAFNPPIESDGPLNNDDSLNSTPFAR